MQGWNIDYENMELEEVLDTCPELYKQRALAAIREERYCDAIDEAKIALKYSDGEIKYHFIIIKALFNLCKYEKCFDYIHSSDILDYVYEKLNFDINRNDLMEMYMRCWRECGYELKKAKVIVVYTNNQSMVDNLQEAINVCSPNQYIYILEDTQKSEGINKELDCEGCVIDKGNIFITGDIVRTKLIINGGRVEIKNMQFLSKKKTFVIKASGGKIHLDDVKIRGCSNFGAGKARDGYDIGVYVCNGADINVDNCEFSSLHTGIYADKGKVCVKESSFGWYASWGYNGIVAAGEIGRINVRVEDTKFQCYNCAISAGYNLDLNIIRSKIELDGELSIDGSKNDYDDKSNICVQDCEINTVVVYSGGELKLTNTKLGEIVMKDAKIWCENCESIGNKVLIRKVQDGNVIKMDKLNFTESSTTYMPPYRGLPIYEDVLEHRWILEWGEFPLAEDVKYVVETYDKYRYELKGEMDCQVKTLMKNLRKVVAENDVEKTRKISYELTHIFHLLKNGVKQNQ